MPPILTSYSKIGTGTVSNGSSRARRKAFPPYAQTLLYHTTPTKDEIISPKLIKATFVKQPFSKFPRQECHPFCYSHLLSHLNHQEIASSRTTFTLLFQAHQEFWWTIVITIHNLQSLNIPSNCLPKIFECN